MESCILRGKLNRAFELGDSRVEVRHLQMRCSQIADVSAIIRAQSDCRSKLVDRTLAVAALQESQP